MELQNAAGSIELACIMLTTHRASN